MRVSFCLVFATLACGDADPMPATDAGVNTVEPNCDRPMMFERSPAEGLAKPGWHRLYVQGAAAMPGSDGRFAMTERRNEVESGDHFLLGAGALVEWTHPVIDPVSGHVFLHIAHVDDPGVQIRYELSLIQGTTSHLMLTFDDSMTGVMGYRPFERCFYGDVASVQPAMGDKLLLRVTNLTDGMLGVVTKSPDYFTWIEIEVK